MEFTVLQACLLLALIAATRGHAVTRCSQTNVTALKDALRHSACRLQTNREGEMFRAGVRARNGLPGCKLLQLYILDL